MYRIFILSLLAIVFSTFALEPSQVILRATEIRWDAMVLEWSAIEGAKSYKVLYDEESLLNLNAPEPILESAKTETTRIEIQKMMEWTPYYLIVHGFDETGMKVGQTIPLHASTLRSPVFMLKESNITDDQNISLIFSRPIDLKNTQIEIVNSETKKPRATKTVILSTDDLRIVQIQLEGKLAPDMSHDIVLKKVTDISGLEMSAESKKTSTIIFSPVSEKTPIPEVITEKTDIPLPEKETLPSEQSLEKEIVPLPEKETPPVLKEEKKDEAIIAKDIAVTTDVPVEAATQPDAALDALEQKTEEMGIERVEASIPLDSLDDEKTPVVIDRLPQTGMSAFFLLGIALICWAVLSYKKKTSL